MGSSEYRIYTETNSWAIARAVARGDDSLLDRPIGAVHTSGLLRRTCVAKFELPASAGLRGFAPSHVAPLPLTLRNSELRMFREILSFFTKSQTEAGMAADF